MKKILLTVAMLLSAAAMQASAPMRYSSLGGANIAFSNDAVRVPVGTMGQGAPSSLAGIVQGTPRVGGISNLQTTGAANLNDLEFRIPVAR